MIASLGIGVVAMGLMPLADLLPEAIRGGWLGNRQRPGSARNSGIPRQHDALPDGVYRPGGTEASVLRTLGAFLRRLVCGKHPGRSAAPGNCVRDADIVARSTAIPLRPVRRRRPACWRPLGGFKSQRDASHRSSNSHHKRVKSFRWEYSAIFAVAVFLWATAEGAAQAFFNVYLDTRLDVTTFQIGIIIAIARIAGIPASLAAPDITRRIGNGQTAALASLGAAVSLIPLALVQHWAAAGAAFVAVNISVGILAPASYLFMFALVAERWRLTIASISIGAGVAGFAAIALGGGFMIARLDYPIFFLTSAAITAVGVLLFWLRFVRPPQSADLPVSAAGAAPD